jgi:hypothetical protein
VFRLSRGCIILILAFLTTPVRADDGEIVPLDCRGEKLAQRLGELFPPATPAQRMQSAQALGQCSTTAVQGALAGAIQNEPDALIRAAMAEALGHMRSSFALWALSKARRDPEPAVRAAADKAYASVNVPEIPLVPTVAAPEVEHTSQPVAKDNAKASPDVSQATANVVIAPTAITMPVIPRRAVTIEKLSEALRSRQAQQKRLTLLPEVAVAAKAPKGPMSGVPLLVTTSLLAGGVWGSGLALMADQNSAGVMLLLGSAGAVIGGGTAFALSRFGVRPTVAQSIWFSNSAAWGGLAGLMAYAGSGAEDSRLQAGLLVGGESLGLALGAWSAARYKYSVKQTALADGLVVGSALSIIGMGRWSGKNDGIPAWMGYGTAPLMLGSAVLAQRISPTKNDLRLIAISSAASSLSLGLFSSGLAGKALLDSHEGQGGLVAGLGLGFIASTLASPWVEPTSKQLSVATGGGLAGAAFGVGTFMLAFPDEDERAHMNLGAAVGAASFATAGYLLAPRLTVGSQVIHMTASGALLSAGLWSAATNATRGDFLTGQQTAGGALALAVSGGMAGAWASNFVKPAPSHYAGATAATIIGATGGLGIAKLSSSAEGGANLAGVLAGGAAGLSLSAWTNHKKAMTAPEVTAGASGGLYGMILAANLRNIGHQEGKNDRIEDGAQYLGLSLGVLAGASAARLTNASEGQVLAPSIAMGLGMVMGAGAGDLAGDARGARIGSTAGGLGLAAASLLVDQRLKLSEGLGPQWLTLGLWGAAFGGFEGLLLSDYATTLRDHGNLVGSGFLAGTAAGLTTGLVLSNLAQPTTRDYAFTAAGSGLGLTLGVGLSNAFATQDEASSALRFAGSFGGLVSAASLAHFIKPTNVDFAAEGIGAAYGLALGSLVTNLGEAPANWNRWQTVGGSMGSVLGAGGAIAATHLLNASPAQVATTTAGTALGTMMGLGLGMAWDDDGTRSTRIGSAVGLSAGLLGTLAADHWMNLSSVPSTNRSHLIVTGGIFGGYQGFLLSQALTHSDTGSAKQERQYWGSLMFGTTAGATAGALLSNSLHPDNADLWLTGAGSAVGSVMGTGASYLISSKPGVQDPWSTLAGSMTGLVAASMMQRYAPLSSENKIATTAAISFGTVVGSYQGLLLGNALSYAKDSTTTDRQQLGGIMFGGAAGAISGIVLSKSIQPAVSDYFVVSAGSAMGSLIGTGASWVTTSSAGKHDAWATMAGSLTGMMGAATVQRYAPISGADTAASGLGLSLGALVGGLSPSLGRDTMSTSDRINAGGLMLGAGAGSVLGVVSRKTLNVDANTVMTSTLGAFHGALTGMETGALFDGERGTQGRRIGAVAGALTGSGLGALSWKNVSLKDASDRHTVIASTSIGGWSGYWASRLMPNHEKNAPDGIIAGAGLGSLLAISAAPYVDVSDDLISDALVMDALFSGAAGGAAMMISTNDKTAAAAVLASGGAGLLIGGAFHKNLHLKEQSAPLLNIAIVQGAFTGRMLPSLLYKEEVQSNRRIQGGMLVGTLGGAATGLLLTSLITPTTSTAVLAGIGSASGAAIGGGIGLISDSIGQRGGAAFALGGSLAGLTAGALSSQNNKRAEQTIAASTAGAAIGAAEGLVFSWAARGTSDDQYKGSMMVGAGLGATLALASATTETWQVPAAAGFGAWGVWVGSFSGAMFKAKPQEATFGGLLGLNLGVAAGYGALSANLVEPGDFGWLSLFGAAGTLFGGATGALFSSSENPKPAFVGLAAGPVAGMAIGAMTLPTWRRLRGPKSENAQGPRARTLAEQVALQDLEAPPKGAFSQWARAKNRKLSSLIELDQVMPLVGALPNDGQSGTPTPFVMGLSGKWR